jgi:hypothetical protein
MEERIAELKSKLTGNFLKDLDIQQEIWELKKIMAAEKGELSELFENYEEDEDCLYCGS